MRIREWFKSLWSTEEVPETLLETNELEVDPFDPFPEPVAIEITDIIDLHTIAPRDVKDVVEEYLREAHARGFRSVRIIHGKGIGVQRQMVRSLLARTSSVLDWVDAPPEAGGLGATIVRFRPSDK
ncbi:MAG: Smr protein/MutS2 [Acidobacteria bacterium]|nr:Smr protein/MutS2 [Acidobacteriota bacterium]